MSLSWPRGISAKLNFNSERPAPHPPQKPCLQLNLQILTTILFSGSAVFYWYIQMSWCEFMFISLSIYTKSKFWLQNKERFLWYCSIISSYALLSSEISGWWHLTLKPSNFGKASSISIFARLGLSPKATDQIAKPCVILHNSKLTGWGWIHPNDEDV